jgi:putative DNA primase/helicase
MNEYPAVTDEEVLPILDPDLIINCLYEAEVGDAKLFAERYKDRLTYEHSEKTWFYWSGHYWQRDNKAFVKKLFGNQLAAQYRLCAQHMLNSKGITNTDEGERARKLNKELMTRATQLQHGHRINSVLSLAESYLASTHSWDTTPMLIGTKNGVIDLKTGQLRPGRPDDHIRVVIPTEFRSLDEKAPIWEKTLSEIFKDDPTKIEYLQRLLGYALIGNPKEHVMVMFVGAGRNGKDTIMHAVETVLGLLVGPVSSDVLLEAGKGHNAGAATPHLMPLRGRRIAIVSETNVGQRFNTAQVKLLTGGGKIAGRPNYGSMIEFEPTHTMLLMTNNKPRVSSDDYAFWQRAKVIDYNQSFVDSPNPNKQHEHKKNPNLWATLETESSGILSWLVLGCLKYQELGLAEPNSIRESVEEYKLEEDEIGQFIAQCCNTGPKGDGLDESGRKLETQSKHLYSFYQNWCSGEGRTPENQTVFGKGLSNRFDKITKTYVFYQGVRLNEDHVKEDHVKETA